jgi:tRNA modification GTPase TrmE
MSTIAAIATAMSNSGIGIIRISGDKSIEIADKIFISGKKNNKNIDKMSGIKREDKDENLNNVKRVSEDENLNNVKRASEDENINSVKKSNEDQNINDASLKYDNQYIKVIENTNKKEKKLKNVKSHTIHYGNIVDDGSIIDEVLISVMKGPNSYTAEDIVEINCHGGVLVMTKILDLVIKNGARPAEPGEFTKRAFLNGKIDLSQAEAVVDIINARSEYALSNSVNQITGHLSEKIKRLRETIIYQIALIESALDDPEHSSLDNYPNQLKNIIEPILDDLNNILKLSEMGNLLSEGIKTVILGKPNVGKSSLMNVLLGEERAIVTDVAGTTRDAISEIIDFNGITLNIIDTAGIRDTEDIVEKIGIEKAKKFADEAALILYIVDASKEIDENDKKIIELIKNKNVIIILNKIDLESIIDENLIEKITCKKAISVSLKEYKGLNELEKAIKDMFFQGKLEGNSEIYLTNIRQKEALKRAVKSLNMVMDSIENEMPEDFYSIDLMEVYEQLGFIIGEKVEEDLVNQIFSKFCMGK